MHRNQHPDTGENLFLSRELRATLIGLLIAALAGWLALDLAYRVTHGEAMMTDFSSWQLSRVQTTSERSSGSDPSAFFANLQPQGLAQRHFRIVLQLEAPAAGGSFMAAQRSFEVEPGQSYCFDFLMRRALSVPAENLPADAFVARLLIDGNVTKSIPLPARPPGHWVTVRGIRPRDRDVSVRLEVRSTGTPAELQVESSRVYFEFARWYRCRQSTERTSG